MLKVLAQAASQAAKVAPSLWSDFHGEGPDSGMWWRGRFEEVSEYLEIKTAQDIEANLEFRSLVFRDDLSPPLVELRFRAAFEDEHGVGVLTDGEAIVGLRYSHDATPFLEVAEG